MIGQRGPRANPAAIRVVMGPDPSIELYRKIFGSPRKPARKRRKS